MPTVDHPNLTGTALHEDKRIKEPVRAASTANVTLSAPGAAMDGVTLTSGDRILLTNQTSAPENGLYSWNGAAVALTRVADADSASDFVYGFKVYVREGTANGGKYYTYTASSTVTMGTTSLTFSQDGGSTSYGTPGSSAVGDSINAGAASTAARSDHRHGREAFGTPGSSAVGDSPAAGSATTVAHSDHVHGREAFATPGASAFGDTAAAGSATTISRSDHRHSRETGVVIQSAGSTIGTRPTINFVSGATAADNSGSNRVDVTVSGGGGGGFGGLAGTPLSNSLTGDVTLTTINTFYDGPSLSLGAGSWFLDGAVTLVDGAGAAAFQAKLWDGASNVIDSAQNNTAGANGVTTIAVSGYVTITTTTTFKISVANSTRGGSTMKAAMVVNSAGNNASTLTAVGIGGLVLLTSNSNLIQETITTSAQATIAIPNIPQGYRDLRVEVIGRSDGAVTFTNCQIQANGDTSAIYSWQALSAAGATASGNRSTAQTSGVIGYFAGASALATSPSSINCTLPAYTNTTFFKQWDAQHAGVLTGAATGIEADKFTGQWASTAAITSLVLSLASGNFVAGTIVRVYGEPASVAGPSVGTGTRLRIGSNQSITTATATLINWDTEDQDADNQHYTSSANLTGTVAKTASSTTLTGTSTAFTTELSVGQMISVPGTAAEKRVVTAIASNTSLTVATAFANTATGQTAARVNSAIVFRQPGFYTVDYGIYWAALTSGLAQVQCLLNGSIIDEAHHITGDASPAPQGRTFDRNFQQWDYIEVQVTQNSGGSVNVTADERTHFTVSGRPTVIAASPYVLIQDQKAQNTAGGTFTSGADQTRTLNTIVSDTSSIATLSSNQITVGPGSYRIKASATGYQCGSHQAFLFNTTDSSEIARGTSEASGASSGTATRSTVDTKVKFVGTKTFELRHRCGTTSSTNGFGLPANFGTEVYATVEIWKEG